MASSDPVTPESFVAEWKGRNLSERQAAHAHFIQLCRLLGVDAPLDRRGADNDYLFDATTQTAGSHAYAAGKSAKKRRASDPDLFASEPDDADTSAPADHRTDPTFESVVSVVSSKSTYGFADVWKKGCFCWEYKRQDKHADLKAALAQLRLYAPSLGNPPLLIVCDIDTFEIHTNFTNYPTTTIRFTLDELANPPEEWITQRDISPLNLLRAAFDLSVIEKVFRPSRPLDAITEDYASRIAVLADELDPAQTEDGKPVSRQEVAHFLMQIVFCMFAEDINLLPHEQMTRLLQQGNTDPKGFTRKVRSLFKAMAVGGDFGQDTIDHFNGGLFKGVDSQPIPRLTAGQLGVFVTVGKDDWSAIEPSILGTLFERALNSAKRSQRGAHYTSRKDIMLIIEPVILAPLRREWSEVQSSVAALIAKRDKPRAAFDKLQKQIKDVIQAFHDRLTTLTILDPACGSGNFLYVAIQCLLDLEREVIAFAIRPDINVPLRPKVSPRQLRGIEIDEYAAELARISIWIGYLKWKHINAIVDARRPILDSLDTIENRDAILDLTKKLPTPAKWPEADFIVGNPPFLGTKMLRSNLGDEYVETLFKVYKDRIPGFSDLVCYWFELARAQIERRKSTRVGLLATQAIRNGESRVVLERIKKTGDIFMAWSDRPWTLDGAAVQVSMVGFDSGHEPTRTINGSTVPEIHPDLSSDVNTTSASPLPENELIGFVGDVKGGSFDIDLVHAMKFLRSPGPNGRSVLEVVRPYTNGLDAIRRNRAMWVIDFGSDMPAEEAAAYGAAFDHIERVVKPERTKGKPTRSEWWLHMRPCPSMREAIKPLSRYLATPTLAKHRVFVWMAGLAIPDHQLIVFGRSDDYFFGVLHSSLHEVWSHRQGTQLEDRPRYTPTSTFETFPLPWPPGQESIGPKTKGHAVWKEISLAAAKLDGLREAWLNPPEEVAAVETKVDITFREQLAEVPADVRPLVRRSAIMAEAAKHKVLGRRTLTNLYNERPAWLRLAHERLDRAVLAAYSLTDPGGGWDPDWASVYEPFGAGNITIRSKGTKANPADTPEIVKAKQTAIARRAETDAKILAALLRLNGIRARSNPK